VKRLIELIEHEHDASAGEALLARLVRGSIDHAKEAAPMDRGRILRHVLGGERRSGAPRHVRLVVVAVILMTGAAAAAAAAGRLWRPAPRLAPVFAVASVPPAEEPPAAAGAPASPPPLDPSAAPPATDPAPESNGAPAPLRSTSDAPSAHVKARLRAAAYRDGEDPTPVLEAIRALRQEGDAARAGDLLASYLRAHPRGVLAEDALALSIEAAAARHDARAASDLGRRYLAQFPNGRFRAFVLRAGRP
jgi:hypothetical protein